LPQAAARVLQAAGSYLCRRVSNEFDRVFGRRRSLGNDDLRSGAKNASA
jgi:hypothetical protein